MIPSLLIAIPQIHNEAISNSGERKLWLLSRLREEFEDQHICENEGADGTGEPF